jgi:hypothetical protein
MDGVPTGAVPGADCVAGDLTTDHTPSAPPPLRSPGRESVELKYSGLPSNAHCRLPSSRVIALK